MVFVSQEAAVQYMLSSGYQIVSEDSKKGVTNMKNNSESVVNVKNGVVDFLVKNKGDENGLLE